MYTIVVILLLLKAAMYTYGTCTFESDFGFTLNCNLKKSGLFRVNNLGGLKGFVDIGFSLGDELGFTDNFSSLKEERRRALNSKDFNLIEALPTVKTHAIERNVFVNLRNNDRNATSKTLKETLMTVASSLPMGVPAFRPIAQVSYQIGNRKHYMSGLANPVERKDMNWVSHKNTIKINNYNENISDGTGLAHEKESPENYSKLKTANTVVLKSIADIRDQYSPLKKINNNDIFKVMNAPKEYYPLGYEKSYDDNFKSKVDLPQTNFTCRNQTHFPGLYADIDLSCMVFHVCALTDEGIVRKSFLCPESTLFDQTVLKCNWWFYIDCYNSHNIYDSNIPVSKSYQLIKSLTYFSKHK